MVATWGTYTQTCVNNGTITVPLYVLPYEASVYASSNGLDKNSPVPTISKTYGGNDSSTTHPSASIGFTSQSCLGSTIANHSWGNGITYTTQYSIPAYDGGTFVMGETYGTTTTLARYPIVPAGLTTVGSSFYAIVDHAMAIQPASSSGAAMGRLRTPLIVGSANSQSISFPVERFFFSGKMTLNGTVVNSSVASPVKYVASTAQFIANGNSFLNGLYVQDITTQIGVVYLTDTLTGSGGYSATLAGGGPGPDGHGVSLMYFPQSLPPNTGPARFFISHYSGDSVDSTQTTQLSSSPYYILPGMAPYVGVALAATNNAANNKDGNYIPIFADASLDADFNGAYAGIGNSNFAAGFHGFCITTKSGRHILLDQKGRWYSEIIFRPQDPQSQNVLTNFKNWGMDSTGNYYVYGAGTTKLVSSFGGPPLAVPYDLSQKLTIATSLPLSPLATYKGSFGEGFEPGALLPPTQVVDMCGMCFPVGNGVR